MHHRCLNNKFKSFSNCIYTDIFIPASAHSVRFILQILQKTKRRYTFIFYTTALDKFNDIRKLCLGSKTKKQLPRNKSKTFDTPVTKPRTEVEPNSWPWTHPTRCVRQWEQIISLLCRGGGEGQRKKEIGRTEHQIRQKQMQDPR